MKFNGADCTIPATSGYNRSKSKTDKPLTESSRSTPKGKEWNHTKSYHPIPISDGPYEKNDVLRTLLSDLLTRMSRTDITPVVDVYLYYVSLRPGMELRRICDRSSDQRILARLRDQTLKNDVQPKYMDEIRFVKRRFYLVTWDHWHNLWMRQARLT